MRSFAHTRNRTQLPATQNAENKALEDEYRVQRLCRHGWDKVQAASGWQSSFMEVQCAAPCWGSCVSPQSSTRETLPGLSWGWCSSWQKQFLL